MIIKKYSLKETMFNLIKIIIILTYSQTSKEVLKIYKYLQRVYIVQLLQYYPIEFFKTHQQSKMPYNSGNIIVGYSTFMKCLWE